MKRTISILFFVLFSIACYAQNAPGTAGNRSITISHLVDKEARSLKNGGIAVTIAGRGGPVWGYATGWDDKAKGIPLSPDTPLPIASVTKLFTATAVLQVYEEGLLDLHAPLERYIPEYEAPGGSSGETTLAGLLTHYSPLPSDILKGFYADKEDSEDPRGLSYLPEFLGIIASGQTPSGGAEVYRYSNAGYKLAAASVSRISGISYRDYVTAHIFKPLGMEDSGFITSGNSAYGYSHTQRVAALPNGGMGDDGIICSSSDLGRFAAAFLRFFDSGEKNILSPRTAKMMFEKQNTNAPYDFSLYRGFGWYKAAVPGYPDMDMYYHEGGAEPFSASLVLVPGIDAAVAVLANEDEKTLMPLSLKIVQELIRERTGRSPANPLPVRKKVLDNKFLGTYATELGLMIISNGGLRGNTSPKLKMAGLPRLRLVPKEEDLWGVTLKLFGLIPISFGGMSTLRVGFAEVGGQRIFGIFDNGMFMGIGTRFYSKPVHPDWAKHLGPLAAANPDPIPFLESASLEIDKKTGIPMFFVKVKSVSDMFALPIDLSNPDYGLIYGMGRHLGETIRVIDYNGGQALWYSGHILVPPGKG